MKEGEEKMTPDYKKYKILLIIANSRWNNKRPWFVMPAAAPILTAILKKEFNFDILDANALNLSEDQFRSHIKERNPDVVLVSGPAVEYYKNCHTTFALTKSVYPNAITVLGGVYPTLLGEDAMKDRNLDYVFLGHAEERVDVFLKLILSNNKDKLYSFSGIGFRTPDGNITINPVMSYIFNVKTMVNPDYALLDYEPYLCSDFNPHSIFNVRTRTAGIITSYGCKFSCFFCASKAVCGRGVAYRPIEDILEEIDYLVAKYRIQELVFFDELVLGDKERTIRLLNRLIEKKYNLKFKLASMSAFGVDDEFIKLLKRAGFIQFVIAVESGSERVLREIIHKPYQKLEIIKPIIEKCKELGMIIMGNFIIGLPGEKWEEIRATFRFAEECDFDFVVFNIAYPSPGTDLYRVSKEQKLLPDNFSFFNDEAVGYRRSFITTNEFTPNDLAILSSYEWDRINFSTPEKTAKIAELYGMSVEQINKRRKEGRQNLGIVC